LIVDVGILRYVDVFRQVEDQRHRMLSHYGAIPEGRVVRLYEQRL
jgi:hypothetical protein